MIDQKSRGWFARLKSGLEKSSQRLTGNLKDILLKRKLDKNLLSKIEDQLIQSDLGVAVAKRLSDGLAKQKFDQEITPDEVKQLMADEIINMLNPVVSPLKVDRSNKPHVILICGVNGSGKTTTIGKLASQYVRAGYKTILAAGDTFRAAAVEQLQIWGERAGCAVVAKETGTDPASLAYDALDTAIKEKVDVLIIDTAGRLQNRTDLMDELDKIIRVIKKIDKTAPHDIVLVMDSTIGQNAHNQVEVFKKVVNISGLIITKLDGSAKGGVVVALAERFGINIHAIGVGENVEDLNDFNSSEFARSLLNL